MELPPVVEAGAKVPVIPLGRFCRLKVTLSEDPVVRDKVSRTSTLPPMGSTGAVAGSWTLKEAVAGAGVSDPPPPHATRMSAAAGRTKRLARG
jgi:hypothetical protein